MIEKKKVFTAVFRTPINKWRLFGPYHGEEESCRVFQEKGLGQSNPNLKIGLELLGHPN